MTEPNDHRRLVFAALAVGITLPIIFFIPFLEAPLGRDQSNWMLIAMNFDEGRVLYRDITMVSTPGLGVLMGSLRSVFGHLPGLIVYTVQVSSVIGASLGFFWYSRRLYDVRSAAIGSAVFSALYSFLFFYWEIAQKDTMALVWLTFGLAALSSKSWRERPFVLAVVSGACVGIASLFKTPFGIAGVALWLLAMSRVQDERDESRGLLRDAGINSAGLVVGFALAWLPLLGYLLLHGAWPDAWSALFGRAGAYGGAFRVPLWDLLRLSVVRDVLGLGPIVFLLLLPTVVRRSRWRHFAWTLAPVLICYAIYLTQGRGWFYQAIPMQGALIAMGVTHAAHCGLQHGRRAFRVIAWVGIVGSVLFIVVTKSPRHIALWHGYQMGEVHSTDPSLFVRHAVASPSTSETVARLVRETTAPDDTIFVWGMESQVYVYANRLNAGVACCDAPIHHPQLYERRPDYFDRQLKKFLEILDSNPPVYFIIATNDANPVEPLPSNQSFELAPGLADKIRSHYAFMGRIGTFQVFRLRTLAEKGVQE